MQAPVFYDPSIPQYLSYGAFGSVSGHELSHGKPVLEYVDAPWLIQLAFDSMGRHYDETGNFTDWWDDSTVEAFEDKAQCFIDQYHKFTVPNPNGEPLHVNGRLTVRQFHISSSLGLIFELRDLLHVQMAQFSTLCVPQTCLVLYIFLSTNGHAHSELCKFEVISPLFCPNFWVASHSPGSKVYSYF